MKNLTKIFMAVAVAMFAFSCVNDATEDIAVKVGGKTTLAISLGGGNRTTLGEAADGVYPITWAEGDQITVNGETSEPLAAADADTANAVFTFNAELAAPYCVAYPAAEAGQVVFAAEQEYVDGTFANGAATMYGYARNGNITLNHLTGVLKIGVVCGEDVDFFDAPIIQSVKISTIDRAPIAGAFNIDFETGVVTPTAEAVNVITYTLDEKLSQSPTYLHVAVPAGVYNELYVTLEDSNGGVMYKTVEANDDKPLAAGKVREFSSDIVYKATTTTDKHIIKDYSSLLAFKNAVEGGSQLDAVFAGDVDLNGVNWGSINAANYKGTVYGNGFAINNLDAPLFDNTGASFKGLHLNVNIVSEINAAAFAVNASSVVENTPVTFENCTVSGTIKIDNANTTLNDKYTASNSGSFVAKAYGVEFRNCINDASIVVLRFVPAAQTATAFPTIGGIAGYTGIAQNCNTGFYNCTNNGDFTMYGMNEDGTLRKTRSFFGGMVGFCAGSGANITFDNCTNNGDFTINGSYGIQVGGMFAYSEGATGTKKTFTFAGVVTNNGDILLTGKFERSFVYVGGISGQTKHSTFRFDNAAITNNGSITFDGESSTNVCLGGIIGVADSDGATNNSYFYTYKPVVNNGDITITENAVITADVCKLGGVFGWIRKQRVSFNSAGEGRLVNEGNITIGANDTALKTLYIGGVAAHDDILDLSGYSGGFYINKGDIINRRNVTENCYVGGVFGNRENGTMSAGGVMFANTGDITLTGTCDSTKEVLVAGIVAKMLSSKSLRRTQCYCTIVAEGYPNIGMVAAHKVTGTYYEKNFIGGSINGEAITEANMLEKALVDNVKTSGVHLLKSADEIVYSLSDSSRN